MGLPRFTGIDVQKGLKMNFESFLKQIHHMYPKRKEDYHAYCQLILDWFMQELKRIRNDPEYVVYFDELFSLILDEFDAIKNKPEFDYYFSQLFTLVLNALSEMEHINYDKYLEYMEILMDYVMGHVTKNDYLLQLFLSKWGGYMYKDYVMEVGQGIPMDGIAEFQFEHAYTDVLSVNVGTIGLLDTGVTFTSNLVYDTNEYCTGVIVSVVGEIPPDFPEDIIVTVQSVGYQPILEGV